MRWAIPLFLLSATAASAEERPRISSGFGERSDPLHGRRAVHRGLDMPGRQGTPILAAAGGIVRVAGRRGSYGQLVEIAHPNGTATRYAHLSRILVRAGEAVAQGQVIAQMGSTGRSTGSHLHFEYRVGGVAIDPRPCFGRSSPRTCSGVHGAGYVGSRGSSISKPARWTPEQVRGDVELGKIPHRSRFARMRDAQAATP